jgi:hypothetical protein
MARLGRLGLMAIPLLVGCSGSGEEWGGRIAEVDGVLRVENPTAPLIGSEEITVDLLWRSSGPIEGDFWEAPNKVHADESFVYIVDRQASKIHRLSLEGELRPSLGGPGGGPGQYGRIIDAVPTRQGLIVIDGGNGRVEVLSPEGEITASSRLGQVVLTVAPLGEDAVAVWGMLGREERWRRVDAEAYLEDLIFPEFIEADTAEAPPSRAGTWRGFPARLRFTAPQIQVFSPSGELKEVIDVPLEVQEATDGEIEAMVSEITSFLAEDGVSSDIIQEQANRIRSRPRAKSRFRDFRFDSRSGLAVIWEQNPEDFGSGPASLHLLSTGGIYLGVLRFDRAWSAFDLRDGVLYVLARDPATDLATLEAHSIGVPSGILERASELASDVSG